MASKFFDMAKTTNRGHRAQSVANSHAESQGQAPDPVQLFVQQETLLIGLNLFALTGLLVIQWLFRGITDPLSFDFVMILFVLRIVEQSGEVWWLQHCGHSLSEQGAHRYGSSSIFIHLVFAFAVSCAANSVDAHYSVLLILPIIAASFRFGLWGLTAVMGITAFLAIAETWIYFLRNPPVDVEEFFEAATVSLVYIVVGSVVWGLAKTMRANADRLQRAFGELEQARDKLVEEEKLAAAGRLASSIAHEVRNPVAMITTALATAGKAGTSESLREELYGIAAKEAARLERVTTGFLDYARPRRPEKRQFLAGETLDYVAGLIRVRAAQGTVRVAVDCPEDLLLHADPFQIQQALLNLGLNAVEYVAPGGRITLGAGQQDRQVHLYVENEGPPVPEEKVQDIFEPFYTTRPEGTGLGLPTSRNICRAHGGDLQLTCNGKGKVRFTAYLPLD